MRFIHYYDPDHARQRAKERYDLDMTKRDMRELVLLIQINGGRSRAIERHSNSRTTHLVWFRGRVLVCIYSSTMKRICTLLPVEGFSKRYGFAPKCKLAAWQSWLRNNNNLMLVSNPQEIMRQEEAHG